MASPIVDIDRKLGFLWATITDSITMDNYRLIETAITENLTDPEKGLVVDCRFIDHIYSSGLGLLVRLVRIVRDGGGQVFLVNVSQRLRDLFEAVKLERVFTMYTTDTEFEISQGSAWKSDEPAEPLDFIYICNVENGICRINLSGQMSSTNDLSAFGPSVFREGIERYVFDLTGLEFIDSHGMMILLDTVLTINRHGGSCVAYGANESVRDMFEVLALEENIPCCPDERSALKKINAGRT